MTPDLTTADPRTLNAPDLVKFTRALLAKEDRRTHWTVAAIALGRITDERIFERTEFGAAISEEAWAKDTLGMTRGEVRLTLKLWRAMGRHPGVPWAALPKPRALLLDEVLTAGGGVAAWTMLATQAKSTSAFETDVRRQLKEEVFLRLTIAYPESMAELVEEAFRRAAYAALGEAERQSTEGGNTTTQAPAPTPPGNGPTALWARWRSPAVAFRALEVLCVTFLQETESIPEREG